MTALVTFLVFAAAEPPTFEFVGTGDERPIGQWVKLNADGSAEVVATAGNNTVRDLIALRLVGMPRPAFPRGAVLHTTTGDRIAGNLLRADGRALHFSPECLPGDWSIPLSSVAVVWLSRPPAETPTDLSRYPWLADQKRDLILLRNGDVARGTFLGFDKDLRLKPDVGMDRSFSPTEPSAIAFDPSLARTKKPQGPYVHLVLIDGTRIDVFGATSDKTLLRGKTAFGFAIEIPLEKIVSLDMVNSRATYLSDLKPSRAEGSGFLGTIWPVVNDRNVHGEPLRLLTENGEEIFDKGLGTHPKTTLSYALNGKYRRFEATVGLDAVSGRGGSAVVRIKVDGKDATPESLRKPLGGKAVPLRIDLNDAKELILEVDFGPAGDVRADVNWGQARVVE